MRGPHSLSMLSVALSGALLIGMLPGRSALAQAAPATQPANSVLLVLPITAPAQPDQAWMGRAIQQDLVADLSQMSTARVISPSTMSPANDEQSALDQARMAGAGFAVYAQAQVSGNQLRVTGEVLDVTAGKPIGSLKATAPTTNLFPLEDSLAAQTVHALPYPLGMAGAPQPPQPSYSSQSVPQTPQYSPVQVPTETAASPYYSYTEVVPPTYYSYNPYYYSYPYWGYPYYGPYWGGVYLGFGGYWGGHYWHGGYGHYGYGRGGGFRGGGRR